MLSVSYLQVVPSSSDSVYRPLSRKKERHGLQKESRHTGE
ncbi:hypothetical protein HMPREF9141_0402 [Prevotella multiformis DSM 16608]|uniref:Uncharacterized protein n=1 Tax=Prevotella multiformis DSM 16608 TaxID=888743 RepID=F0F486_9BACT|nr:hypothetical protein HMPREF9141_0402 [Prevotella multiformis DSM 16608]